MADLYLIKTAGGQLAPADQAAVDALGKIKLGATVAVSMRQPRNIGHHRKLFALLNVAYESWEPEGKLYKGEPVAKNFDQFRNDITVLARLLRHHRDDARRRSADRQVHQLWQHGAG